MTMNHSQARQLIQAAADGLISEASRRALERHMASCSQCQAYANDLGSLEARLAYGLQARWQDVQPRRFSWDRAAAGATGRKDSNGMKRLYHIVAVPAFQFGALAALAVGLILLIGSAARSSQTADTGSPTPSATSSSESPVFVTSANTCAAVANIDARLYRDHDKGSEVVGVLPHGQTAPVQVYLLDPETGEVWLQIDYNGSAAWVTNVDAMLTGDCLQIMTVGGGSPAGPTPPPTMTSSPTALPPPPVATSNACDVVAPAYLAIFANPDPNALIVGGLAEGQSAPLLAWAHNGSTPVWFQVRVGDVTGWVMWPSYTPESGAPCADLPFVALPDLTPSPTVTSTACLVAPADDPSSDHNVYTGPAVTYPVIGTVGTGDYLTATGIFSQENYNTWVRVDFNGEVGWMSGGSLMFAGGGCWPLQPIDFIPHPATFTPSPTATGPTPPPTYTPTPTPEGGSVEPALLEFGWSVPGTIGTIETYWASFPWQGDFAATHRLSITVTGIPPGSGNDSRRVVDWHLACVGTSSLTWGWASNPGTFGCGDSTRSDGLLWNYNTVQFVIQAPSSWSGTITYQLTASFSAYPE